MDLLPEALERHIASLCESTAALALVSRAWRAAVKDAESHEPWSANGSTWCHRSAALNGPVHMRYLKRIDLTLHGQSAGGTGLLESAATAAEPRSGPLALWVSNDSFDVCGRGPLLEFIKSRCWSTFCCVDYDFRTGSHVYVDAQEVHVNASLLATMQLGPSVRRLHVYEDPLAICNNIGAMELEPLACYRAWQCPGLEHLTFSGLVSAHALALAVRHQPGRFAWSHDTILKPLMGLKTLEFLYTTRAPWTAAELGDFLGLMAPALEHLKIYGSNLVSRDLECIRPQRWSLRGLNLEGNYGLRELPNGCLLGLPTLECLRVANTGLQSPPDGLQSGTLRELSCNLGSDGQAWSHFMARHPLQTIRLVYMNLCRNCYYPAEAMQGASLIEIALKDRFGHDEYFAAVRAVTPRALVRPCT